MDVSKLFWLNKNDFVRGAFNAVFVALVAFIWNASQQQGFDVFSVEWGPVVNAAVYGFIGYLAKNFSSDENGAVFGKFGGVNK